MNEFFLPLTITVALAVAVVLVVWLWHVFNVRACRKELHAFKEQVDALSDAIDSLKRRHNVLPHMDRTFAVPMSGETLATYDGIAERLEHHRQATFNLMEVAEQARTLLDSERILGNGRARSARQKLRAADAPAALAALLGDCEAPLNRIEQAHAEAATELQSYRQDGQQLDALLQSVVAVALSITPYQPDRSAAAALVERAQAALPSDPLATLRCLGEARGKIAEVRRRATKILEHAAMATELAKKLADVQHAATQRRLQGFLLQEAGANPDPLLADVQSQHAATQAALNQANEAAAGTLLSQASAMIEQARQVLDQHVAAKNRCLAELPNRQAEVRRLAESHALARGQHAELTRDFAAETWRGVSENVQRAQASLDSAERYTAEAVRQAAPNVQHYVHAAKLLDQAAQNHKHAQSELTAIGHRLRELVELRAAFQAQIGQLSGRSDRVNQALQSSGADRALANERFRTARLALNRLEEDSRQPRPDWMQLTGRVREIDADLERVEQLAKEDMQLAQQAAAEIAETERAIREARAFRDQGFTPDVSAAESQLAQARGSLSAQGYEEAIRLANAAEQLARSAHQAAIGQAQRRQQELEAQRRAEQAAAAAGPAVPIEAEPLQWTPPTGPGS